MNQWAQNGTPRRMFAMYDYNPQESSPNVDAEMELPFRAGDVITIFGDTDEDGFYIGEIGGRRGLVPSNFLQDRPPAMLPVPGGVQPTVFFVFI